MDKELELFYWVNNDKKLRVKNLDTFSDFDGYEPSKETKFRAIAYLGGGLIDVVDDTHTIIRKIKGELFEPIVEVVSPHMEYGAFLIAMFLNSSDNDFRDLENDEQFSESNRLYSEFLVSEFNNESKSEYDCISDFLNNLKQKEESETLTITDGWLETYYEFVDHITTDLSKPNVPYKLESLMFSEGRCALYDLAKKLTIAYEEKYKDHVYDGEFYDFVDMFYDEYLKDED